MFYDPLKTAGYKTKTASYIEKNCSLNESMEKLRSNEHMEQSVIKTNNILDQCERTVAT
jgi:excinuclease UvrABC helicase subunit UvrB